jgi:hypothetical protein
VRAWLGENFKKYNITNKDNAYKHFIEYGIFEKRIFFKINNDNLMDFYWELYVNYYDDLKNNNINTYEKTLEHFNNSGCKEGRIYFKYDTYKNFYWEKYLSYYNLEEIYFTDMNQKFSEDSMLFCRSSEKEYAITHLLKNNNIFFKIYNFDNFDYKKYMEYYNLKNIYTKKDVINDWNNYGLKQNKIYFLKKYTTVFINEKANEYTDIIVKYILNYVNEYVIINTYYDANIIISHICDDNYYFIDKKDSSISSDIIKILISGEPYDNLGDFNIFITTIINEKPIQNKKYIYYPYLYYSLNEHKYSINSSDYNNTKNNFCAYMYTREFEHRQKYFYLISTYKKVDGLGKCCNNINIENTRSVYNNKITYNDIAVKIYSDYKFVLAIENTFTKGYFTEKLINPIIANSIPIYWGHDYVFNYINKKRVIYIPDFKTDEQLIEYIRYIDNNDVEYNRIINENIYIKSNEDVIEDFKNNIKNVLSLFEL